MNTLFAKPSDQATTFTLDERTGQYRDAQGYIVPWSAIRQAVESVIDGAKQEATELVKDMDNGTIDRNQFQDKMLALIAALETMASQAANGYQQHADLLRAAEGDIEATMTRQRGHLLGFLGFLLLLGVLPKNERSTTRGGSPEEISQRAQSYMDDALITFERQRHMLMQFLDFAEGRRVLNRSAEHCKGCEGQADRGWLPIAQLEPLGNEECGQWCKCDVEYRKIGIQSGGYSPNDGGAGNEQS